MFPRFGLVDVAYPMRGQIYLAILMVGKFVFPGREDNVKSLELAWQRRPDSPLIQPHIVLNKEQIFIGQVRGPQSGCQVDVL